MIAEVLAPAIDAQSNVANACLYTTRLAVKHKAPKKAASFCTEAALRGEPSFLARNVAPNTVFRAPKKAGTSQPYYYLHQ